MAIDSFTIEVLGSGDALSKYNTSFLINGHILLDCGPNIPDLLKEKGLIDKIDTVIFTHRHTDHIGGLEKLLIHKRYIEGFDMKNFVIYAGEDFPLVYSALGMSMDVNGYVGFDFEYIPLIPNAAYSTDDETNFNFTPIPVKHVNGNLPAYAIEFYNPEKKILFTGDIDEPFDGDLSEYELVFHDMGGGEVHADEEDIYKKFGKLKNIYGVHTNRPLKYYKKAYRGQIFKVDVTAKEKVTAGSI